MNSKKLMAVAAAVIAGAVVTASGASASANATATATHSGKTRIMIWSINSDGPNFRELLTGAVGDYGPGVSVHPDGTVDPGHTSQLRMNMTHGSFRLSIAAIDKEIVHAYKHWPHNQATCSGRVKASAQTPVVAGSGTGAYKGITGSFSTTITIDEVDHSTPVCVNSNGFLAQIILIEGTGSVSY
jgi:hypothetical protein